MAGTEPKSSTDSRGWLPTNFQADQVPRRWIELASTILLAIATIATAWSGYQSARWSGQEHDHSTAAGLAIVETGKYANLAEQKVTLQATLFTQWASAVATENQGLATFLRNRFPEPLKTATTAWLTTNPLTNPNAPPTPFDMPEYQLTERAQADQWEQTAEREFEEADRAGEISDGYLMFTIIFASVLFFAGVSGKFGWQALDILVLVLGTIVLLGGLYVLFTSPVI